MIGGVAAAYAVGTAYEATLDDTARRLGSHYTPPEVAEGLVAQCFELAPTRSVLRCCDPACGGGAFLVACAEALVRRGASPAAALANVVGVDSEPGAVAASRAALALWGRAHGLADAAPRVELGDGLAVEGLEVDVVVGNPPFQGQLSRATARDTARREALRDRLGTAAARYVDSAVLFLLAGRTMLADGGVLCLVQPRSTLAADDAAPARAWLAETSTMARAWLPQGRVFDAEVDVWAPLLVATPGAGGPVELIEGFDARGPRRSVQLSGAAWAGLVAAAGGVPSQAGWAVDGTVADLATTTAGFRDEYYALLGATSDGPVDRGLRAVTCGAIDPDVLRWGRVPTRFGKRTWDAPWVDLDVLAATAPRVARWAEALAVPKVLVATQTRIVEAVIDLDGDTVGITPVVSVVPHSTASLRLLHAALSSPPISAWMHHRRAGSGRSADAVRISAGDLAAVPLPADRDALDAVAAAIERGDGPRAVAAAATGAYGLDPAELVDWWSARVPRRGAVQPD